MTRAEIIERFREENPEITTNVASDAVLQSWCKAGNLEIATRARLIKGQTTFAAIVGTSTYNLNSRITNFYDIDELPGGGVAYNDDRLDLETPASLDVKRKGWRTADNGTPTDYYRRNEDLVLGTPPDATSDIEVYSVLIPDPLDDDTKTPFNQLANLEAFHYALVLYLEKRVFGGKVKKPEAAAAARAEYNEYVEWMKNEVNRGIYAKIQFQPPAGYRSTGRTRTR